MRKALKCGIHKAGISSTRAHSLDMYWNQSTHKFPKPSVPGFIEALCRVVIVVDLLNEEVLDALDGEVKPLIVRVVRPREVLLVPPMRPKKSLPGPKIGRGARSSTALVSFASFVSVVSAIHLLFSLNSTIKPSLALMTSPISLSPGSMTRASESLRAPKG